MLLGSCWVFMWVIACQMQGPVSISEKTSFRKISLSLEVARFVSRIVRSLWNLTGTSAALLPMCLSNFKAIRQFKVPISWLRDFTRSYEKTSFRILRRGPGITGRDKELHPADTMRCNYLFLPLIPTFGTHCLISSATTKKGPRISRNPCCNTIWMDIHLCPWFMICYFFCAGILHRVCLW